MLGRLYTTQDCSAARTLESVGERWSLLILRDAIFRHYVRFSDFQRSLGVATNILAKRLDSLVADGIFKVKNEGGHPEYHLTEKGRDLKLVIIALTEWGDRWVAPGPVDFKHENFDEPVKLALYSRTARVATDEVRAVRKTAVE